MGQRARELALMRRAVLLAARGVVLKPGGRPPVTHPLRRPSPGCRLCSPCPSPGTAAHRRNAGLCVNAGAGSTHWRLWWDALSERRSGAGGKPCWRVAAPCAVAHLLEAYGCRQPGRPCPHDCQVEVHRLPLILRCHWHVRQISLPAALGQASRPLQQPAALEQASTKKAAGFPEHRCHPGLGKVVQ